MIEVRPWYELLHEVRDGLGLKSELFLSLRWLACPLSNLHLWRILRFLTYFEFPWHVFEMGWVCLTVLVWIVVVINFALDRNCGWLSCLCLSSSSYHLCDHLLVQIGRDSLLERRHYGLFHFNHLRAHLFVFQHFLLERLVMGTSCRKFSWWKTGRARTWNAFINCLFDLISSFVKYLNRM